MSFRLLSGRQIFSSRSAFSFTRAIPRRHASTSSSLTSSPLRTGLYATVFTLATGIFAVYYFDSRSAIHRYFLTPLLRYSLDAETGHKLAVRVLRSGLGPRDTQIDDERLKVELWGQEIANPVGLAAGFDKEGEAIDGLFNLGFSWVEIGSVTPKPQPGNPKPRVFHLPSDSGLINRYGFPSEGHIAVLNRLLARIPAFSLTTTTTTGNNEPSASAGGETPASLRPGNLLAVNLGKNKSSPPDSISDFVAGVKTFAPYADVLVINVSSPNTPGLRGLQTRSLLEELLAGVIKTRDETVSTTSTHRKPKIVLKIAPDLTEQDIIDIAQVVRTSSVDGVIVSNTTTSRPDSLSHPNKIQQGGLSGTPLKPLSLKALKTLRTHLPSEIPLIGCGGISSGSDALDYAKSGATFVQVYTGFGYDGAGACRRIKDELTELLKAEGTNWMGVVKRATEELSFKQEEDKVDVGTLIKEAEELKKLLDTFGERIGQKDPVAASS